MLKKLKWLLFVISCSFLTEACTPHPPDVPACEYLSQRLSTDPKTSHLILTPSPTCMKQINEVECLHCVFIVSGKEMFVGEKNGHLYNNKPASLLKQQAVYLPAVESYAPLAAYIINSCKKMGCSDDVTKFKVKLDSLNGVENEVDDLISTP